MKAIALLVSLKNQDLQTIIDELKCIRQEIGTEDVLLICAHKPQWAIVRDRTEVPKEQEIFNAALQDLFPVQLRVWNGKPLRAEMALFAKKLDAQTILIGRTDTPGIQQEILEFEKENVLITYRVI